MLFVICYCYCFQSDKLLFLTKKAVSLQTHPITNVNVVAHKCFEKNDKRHFLFFSFHPLLFVCFLFLISRSTSITRLYSPFILKGNKNKYIQKKKISIQQRLVVYPFCCCLWRMLFEKILISMFFSKWNELEKNMDYNSN